MYFCEKRELNCLKRLILQRLIYIVLMDSNNLTPLRKGVVGVDISLVCGFRCLTVLVPLLVGLDPSDSSVYSRYWYAYLSCRYAWKGSYLFGK